MDKINILKLKDCDDSSIYFNFHKFENAHVPLIYLFTQLEMDKKSLSKLNIVFDKVSEDFFYFSNKRFKVCVFINLDKVHVFINAFDRSYKKELMSLISSLFNY